MPNKSWSRSPSLNCHEGELVEQFVIEELQKLSINESSYLLQKYANLFKYSSLTIQNKIAIGDCSPSDNQVEHRASKQLNPGSVTCLKRGHFNLGPGECSTELPEYTTVNPAIICHKHASIEQIYD